MKFLCSNCKAKYQIPNEKVAGRTLRMTCRRCGEEILIRGQFLGGSESGASPSPGAGSALGAGFRKQAPAPPPPPAASAPLWHVAIQDTPVGPLRREEVAARVADGSLDGDSLAWRDGMEDWQPLRDVPELARLLAGRPSAGAPPPPPSHPGFPSPTAEPTPGPSFPPAAPSPPHAAGSAPPAASAPAPPPGGYSAQEPSSSWSSPQADEARRGSRQRGPSWGMMFMMVAGGAFIMMVGIVMGVQLSSSPKGPNDGSSESAAAAEKAEEPSGESETGATPEVELELDDMEPEPSAEDDTEAPSEAEEAPRRARSGNTRSRRQKKQLSAEERDMLARMGGRSGAANLQSGNDRKGGGSAGGGTGLSAAQLRKVVTKGRPTLQRCYETALRGTPSNETIRMDIQINVGTSGKVTRVNARGKGLPGLDRCLERTVRRWVFPSAGDTTRTSFPVVFQPGG